MDLLESEHARQIVLAVELDQDELACRIIEAMYDAKRPVGMTATEAIYEQPAQVRDDARRAAIAAMRYIEERVNAGSSVS